ncbi:MAG: hypothetical protein ACOC0W_02215 [Desulfosalsimonas sp.]
MMVAALLIIFAISVTVFMAARSAVTNSKLMQNSRQYRENLYRAETAMNVALEEHTEKWLNSGSDLFDPEKSAPPGKIAAEIKDSDGGTIKVGKYRAARIEKNPSDPFSRQFYPLYHRAPPAVGSGTSGKKEVRRYGIVASGTEKHARGEVVIEGGFIKVF